MFKRKALFVTLDAVPTVAPPAEPLIQAPAHVLDAIRDYGARGYVIVPVLLTKQGDNASLAEYENVAHAAMHQLRRRTGAPVATVLLLTGNFDPREIWDLARVYELDLNRSLLLTAGGRHAGLFRTAGVARTAELSTHPNAA